MKALVRICLKVAIVFAVLVALAWVVLAIWMRPLQSRLDRELAALKRQGAPVGLDWLTQPAVPPADDALPLLQAARKEAQAHPEPDALFSEDFSDFTKQEWDEVAAWVEAQAKTLELFHQAAHRSRCSRIYDRTVPPPQWKMEPLMAVQGLSQIIEAEFQVKLHEGAPPGEILDGIRILPVLSRFMDDRFTIGWLIRRAIEEVCAQHVRDLAQATDADLVALRSWLHELGDESAVRPLDDLLSKERALSFAIFSPRYGGLGRQLASLTASVDGGLAYLLRSPAGPFLDLRIELDWLERSKPMIEACRVVEAGTPQLLRTLAAGRKRAWYDPVGCPVSQLAPKVATQLLMWRATFAVTEAGLALLQWKRNHAAWPADLARAGVTRPDPFTGGPLGYEQIGKEDVKLTVQIPQGRRDDVNWQLHG